MKSSCFFILLFFPFAFLHAQPNDLPWEVDPDCNSIVTDGIVAITCGVLANLPEEDQWAFGLVDINGVLPATERLDVTSQAEMYHHPSWHIDSIGILFGITMDHCGNIYATASANYTNEFFGFTAKNRYGNIGGGANALSAAGAIYKIDALTGQASLFTSLPQQVFVLQHDGCYSFDTDDRNTGPGLGNITFSTDHLVFYVTNFEDGRIYRIDLDGTILDSYDPLAYDDGMPGPTQLEDLAYGIDISNDGAELFFGTMGQVGSLEQATIYSIPLNPDGSFSGTINNAVLPPGATWDNYTGDETFHYEIPDGSFYNFDYISDLEFDPDGSLLVGNRIGCGSIFSSNNEGGKTHVLQNNGGIYNDWEGVVFHYNPLFDTYNSYGGVSVFNNPAGGKEWVISCGEFLNNQTIHGFNTQPANQLGSNGNPVAPSGMISYVFPQSGRPKGNGRGCVCF